MSDIIDEIDALVDEQLSGYHNRSGYDYNVNQERCPHCARQWHGLKITRRIESMAAQVAYDEGYRYADDDSEVLCPGSRFIGPWATKLQIQAIRTARLLGGIPSVPYTRMREPGDRGIESMSWSAPRIRNNPFSRRNGELRTRPLDGYSLPERDLEPWTNESPYRTRPIPQSGDRVAFIGMDGTRIEGVATVTHSGNESAITISDLLEIANGEMP